MFGRVLRVAFRRRWLPQLRRDLKQNSQNRIVRLLTAGAGPVRSVWVAPMWQSLWREAKREVQTTVGRRRARYTSSPPDSAPPLPPVGRQGIVVEESDEPDGWEVQAPSPAAPPFGRGRLLRVQPSIDPGCCGARRAPQPSCPYDSGHAAPVVTVMHLRPSSPPADLRRPAGAGGGPAR
jgi:hypothetical protein